MSDQSYDLIGHGPILVGHCLMTDGYFQLCTVSSISHSSERRINEGLMLVMSGTGNG